MATRIENEKAPFFPNTNRVKQGEQLQSLKRNQLDRASDLKQMSLRDTKLDIPDAVKDFSRIKRAVDLAPDRDQSEKINDLKNRINQGTYQIDYEALADKMLREDY